MINETRTFYKKLMSYELHCPVSFRCVVDLVR
jgi:hypothetical protein